MDSGCLSQVNSSHSSSGGGRPWDPLVRRQWHPLFDVDKVPLQDVVAAVKDHQNWLLNHHHHHQQQQQRQLGSLAAAAGGGARWQQQVLVARPTRTAARHNACTSCQPLTAPEFLEHLKALSWYQDQVGVTDCWWA
jgi:hypothetical protein